MTFTNISSSIHGKLDAMISILLLRKQVQSGGRVLSKVSQLGSGPSEPDGKEMGREQIKWSLIWRGDHVSLKGAHTQGNRTSEGLVGPLKRVWGPGGWRQVLPKSAGPGGAPRTSLLWSRVRLLQSRLSCPLSAPDPSPWRPPSTPDPTPF